MTAKKSVEKKVAPVALKKAAPKKTTPVKKQALTHARAKEAFWAKDGTIVSNLVELSEMLVTVPPEVFDHHVTRQKNDFADWVEHVLSDAELAKEMRKAKKPNTTRTLVIQRLKIYDV
jgi:hypothetical protein